MELFDNGACPDDNGACPKNARLTVRAHWDLLLNAWDFDYPLMGFAVHTYWCDEAWA
jgi:hypothetical protein